MITLYDVIDTRTDKVYSVAIVSEKNVKWFVPINFVTGTSVGESIEDKPEETITTTAVSGLSDESQETPSEEGDSE